MYSVLSINVFLSAWNSLRNFDAFVKVQFQIKQKARVHKKIYEFLNLIKMIKSCINILYVLSILIYRNAYSYKQFKRLCLKL